MLKILIADDHAVVRKGLIELLREEYKDIEIQEVNNGNDVIDIVHQSTLDLIMLDISMPGRSGIEILKQLRYEGLKTPILILSMQPEEQYALRVLKIGASGFVNKNCANKELIIAVNKVLTGKKYLSATMTDLLAENMDVTNNNNGNLFDNLSDRELEILKYIASGKSISEIAKLIYLSVNTVSTYRARILKKLTLHNNAELTRYAFDNNLVN